MGRNAAAERGMSASRIDNRLRRLRFDAGEMTQAALAARVGVTRQTIAAIEQGKQAPALDTAFRIAEALDRPLADVFRWRTADDQTTWPIPTGRDEVPATVTRAARVRRWFTTR